MYFKDTMKFEDIISNIINRWGIEVLNDSGRFKAIFYDLAPKMEKEKKIIRRLADENKLKSFVKIYECSPRDRRNQMIAIFNELINDVGFSDEWAQETIKAFVLSFGWNIEEIQLNMNKSNLTPTNKNTSVITAQTDQGGITKRFSSRRKWLFIVVIIIVVGILTGMIKNLQQSKSEKKDTILTKNSNVTKIREKTKIMDYDQALFYQQRNSMVNIQTGDSFLFGEYEQDNNPSNGKEQIEWEVLDKTDNRILVISKKALCCYPYLNEYENTTWADSEMRSWLNRSFYQDAFSSYHQEMILDTEVTADRNPEYSTDSGSDTNDRIYLLSIDEVKKYFNSQSSRMCQPTVYAKVQGSYLLDSNSWWWLRTPGKDGKHISLVYTDGEIVSEGFRTYVTDGTVRPVMWLDLSAVENVDVPAKLLENEKQNECKGIVAIDPSAIGVEDDEVFMEPVGPGAEPEETSYTTGGTGAVTGVREYNINLQIAKDLQEILLQKGYQVVMLRENNESKLMAMNRSLAAAEAGADILVVISCRKRQDIGENGAMAYVQRKSNPYVGYMYDECRDLAECILSEYCNTGIFSNNGIYETDSVRCINWSKIPVTNILLGCIKDVSDEQKLADQSNWNFMAEAIANGIDKYFSMQ